MIAGRGPRRPALAAALCAIVMVAAGTRMHRLTESDNGGELSVAVGDAIEIALPENPGTGYRWIVRAGGEPCLSLESERFERVGSMPGRGGVHHWTFKTVAAGSAAIEMSYVRPWEKNVPPARSFTIKLRAGDNVT